MVLGEIGKTVETVWKVTFTNWWNNLHALLYVGIKEGWRLDEASIVTMLPNSEAADTVEPP